MKWIFLFSCIFLSAFCHAENILSQSEIQIVSDTLNANPHPDFKPFNENKKLVAMALNLTMGMLGAHRLYLGTKPHVPVFYLLTFGGVFFIIPVIDFFVLTFSKDVTPYMNNNKILMWVK